MRILLCLLTCVILAGSAFAQNTFSIVKADRAAKAARTAAKTVPCYKPFCVHRTLIVPRSQKNFAEAICRSKPRCGQVLHSHRTTLKADGITIPQQYIEAQFALARLSKPEDVYGSYNYLRTLFKFSHKSNTVEPYYRANWQAIFDPRTYNGAHHIVNKSTLKEIYADMQAKAAERGLPFPINLTEMQNNAPAIFHRLHGDPDYKQLFHNADRQVGLYYSGGVKMIIEDFFAQLEILSLELNNPELKVPAQVQRSTLEEAELWCQMFYLRWE